MTFPATFNNTIAIALPEGFSSYWSDSQIGDLIKGDYLVLRIVRDDYSVVTDGKGITRLRGFTATFGKKERKYIGFRARVRDNREDLRIALEELAEYTAGENCQFLRPINILDYHYRKNREDRDRGFRIRQGIFEGEISEVSGSVTQGYINCEGEQIIKGNRYGSGFSFKFMETEPVGYF